VRLADNVPRQAKEVKPRADSRQPTNFEAVTDKTGTRWIKLRATIVTRADASVQYGSANVNA
jgi:hypothetical protein